MLDINVLMGVGIMAGIVLLIIFVFPLFKDRQDVYTDVKQGLLLFGYAFRDEKVKAITDLVLNIVKTIEELDYNANEKRAEAVEVAFLELAYEFGLVLDEGLIELLVNIAVAQLPPTHKEKEIE